MNPAFRRYMKRYRTVTRSVGRWEMNNGKFRALTVMGFALVGLATSSCSTPDGLPLKSGAGSERGDLPKLELRAVQERSHELQRAILRLVPEVHIESNSLPKVGEAEPNLIGCDSMLSKPGFENGSSGSRKGVVYPGEVHVQLDRDAPYQEIWGDVQSGLESQSDWVITSPSASHSNWESDYFHTEDDFLVKVRLMETPGENTMYLQIVVWSPCFYSDDERVMPGARVP